MPEPTNVFPVHEALTDALVRIEFTYARRPDHFSGYPLLAERRASPILGYLIAAVSGGAGAAIVVVALVERSGQGAVCGVCGLLLGVGIGSPPGSAASSSCRPPRWSPGAG